MDYKSNLNLFVVRLFSNNNNDLTNLFEFLLKEEPKLSQVDDFYADNLEKGNFFAQFKNSQEVASKMGITIV